MALRNIMAEVMKEGDNIDLIITAEDIILRGVDEQESREFSNLMFGNYIFNLVLQVGTCDITLDNKNNTSSL